MKKFLRFLLWLAGTAVFLLVTAHFTLRHLLNAPKFRTAALARIERTTGRPATLGRIDYELFPFTLVVRDAALREKDGAGDFASIRSFSATVDFRKKEIAALRFERPALRIVQNADGSYNFSDLFAAAPAETAPPPAEPAGGPGRPPAVPRPEAPPAAAPLVIRWVDVADASFEFVRRDAAGEEVFTLSDLNFNLEDFAPNRPLKMHGRTAIGKSSGFQFELFGPAFADYADRPGGWPATFNARLDVRDFADVRAFLPEGTLPFQSLWATLNVHGALADRLDVLLNAQTSAATDAHPVAAEIGLQAELSLPPPVAAHLFGGAELPEALSYRRAPCELPPGAVALDDPPALALLLKHLQGTLALNAPQVAYGNNRFTEGTVRARLQDGTLAVTNAKISAYEGAIEARGHVQLLGCPLTYRLESLTADQLEIGQALAANGLGDFGAVSGTLHLEASASGHAVGKEGLDSLVADARARIENLQTVGSGGSLMDQVWLQLDNPLLLQLLPRLQAKVDRAKQSAASTTTSRYETATAALALRNRLAALSDARLAMPGYRIDVAGVLRPFDDRLDLSGKVVASPEETAQLTGGKNRSDVLPHENGGLMIPFTVRGALSDPKARPDLDYLLKNALAGATSGSSGNLLDGLSKSDRKNVEKGLKILEGFLAP
ncbi:MAG TPA: AsmA-like C-terminal region-containing protein [Kiritimatiellia bacterium]|nr:AsmA-like C-terminal region-containing protein [Kiritimatiellia bacterium]